MNLTWLPSGWKHYVSWEDDKKMTRRINAIIKDILRDPFDGTGKAEPLKHNLAGWWSRRIDDKNRILYRVENDAVIIAQCRGHY